MNLRLQNKKLIALAVAILLVIIFIGIAVINLTSSSPSQKVASWNSAWHPGDPQATHFGRAFQILDKTHPPKNAQSIYWLGPIFSGLYPYVRAMKGGGAETMLSTVTYGDRASADVIRVMITSYNTKPLGKSVQDISPSEGSRREDIFKRLSKKKSGAFSWVDSNDPAPGWKALVQVSPSVILEIIRLDGRAPSLEKLISSLRSYPQ